MGPLREWLFKVVAQELIYSYKGIDGIQIEQLASAAALSVEEVHRLFPDRRAIVLALVDEICAAQKEFILQGLPNIHLPRERLIHFIAASLEYNNQNLILTEAVASSLLGHDPVVKQHVHEVFGRLYALLLDDLVSEGIVREASPLLLSDLVDSLLAVIFLGGCPWLEMEYLSFVDFRKVSIAALDALKKRYLSNATMYYAG